jgi:hypothetical protein
MVDETYTACGLTEKAVGGGRRARRLRAFAALAARTGDVSTSVRQRSIGVLENDFWRPK